MGTRLRDRFRTRLGPNLRLGPGLLGPRLGLGRSVLWLCGPYLRLLWSIVWMHRTSLRLSRPALRLRRAGLRLTGPHLRLPWARWLNLRPVVWFAGSGSWLSGSNFGLAGTADLAGPRARLSGTVDFAGSVSGIRARNAGLRGDGPRSGDDGWTALVDVVELLTVLCGFTLVLKLGRHGRNTWAAIG